MMLLHVQDFTLGIHFYRVWLADIRYDGIFSFLEARAFAFRWLSFVPRRLSLFPSA